MLEDESQVSGFSGKRRTPEEIIETIFKALPTESFKNISHIAELTESSWITIDKYLRLIWRIQRGPRLIANQAGRTNSFVWKKEYGSLPERVNS